MKNLWEVLQLRLVSKYPFLKKAPTGEEIEEILKELDENSDGKLSLEEFKVFVEQILLIINESSK